MTAPEVVTCTRCGRPLSDDESRARGYGPVCAAIVLGVDTHRTPIPRGPRRKRDADQIPLPLEKPVSDEITRILDAAKSEAPDVSDTQRRRIVRGVLEALDALIDDGDEDSTWPDPGDLGLLAADVFPKVGQEGQSA